MKKGVFHHSAEARAKISASLVGNKRSLGYRHSAETRKLMGSYHVGAKNVNWKGGTTLVAKDKPPKKVVASIRTQNLPVMPSVKSYNEYCISGTETVDKKWSKMLSRLKESGKVVRE